MKKIVIVVCFFILFIPNIINAKEERIDVTFSKCIDGDTAQVILNNKKIKLRFLAVDTPETKHPKKGVEFYGTEASNYTCLKLQNASSLQIEYDKNSDKTDKYNRHLVWLWIDRNLFQKQLVENGYAEVAYLYNDYKYTNILKKAELSAKKEKIGIWQNQDNIKIHNYIILIIIVLLIILGCIVNSNFRTKTKTKIKREMKKQWKKSIKKMYR